MVIEPWQTPVVTANGPVEITEAPTEPPLVYQLIAGWDIWNSASAPAASVLAPNITGSAVTTTEGLAWRTDDERGASNDGTWGAFEGPPTASTNAVPGENLELSNATTGGTITFTVANTGLIDIDLDSFRFDAYAFRPKAARTYELSVLPGGGISTGIVFTSPAQAITDVGGAWDNGAHDDIDISLTGLADHTLAAGETVQFRLAFSGGAGDSSGGHDLWVDNVGITGAYDGTGPVDPPVLEFGITGGDLEFTWTGNGFRMQSCTNLMDAVWLDVPGGDTPPVTVAPTNAAAFYRLMEL